MAQSREMRAYRERRPSTLIRIRVSSSGFGGCELYGKGCHGILGEPVRCVPVDGEVDRPAINVYRLAVNSMGGGGSGIHTPVTVSFLV